MSSKAWGNKALPPQGATHSMPELSMQRKVLVKEQCIAIAQLLVVRQESSLKVFVLKHTGQVLLQTSSAAGMSGVLWSLHGFCVLNLAWAYRPAVV